jgi:GNAT superfamily N-acetyltransferase
VTIRFEPLAASHIEPAFALALTAYVPEREHVPALAADGVPIVLRCAIADLVQRGTGVAALDGDRLMGHLAFHGPIERFWGSGTGAFSPLHGSGVAGPNRARLMSMLFQYAAEALVAQGVNTFAITTWRHDLDVAEALGLNGFGVRNADAIRMVDSPLDATPVQGIAFREVRRQDAGPLLPLLNGLVRHLSQSPVFLTASEFTEDAFAALLERRQSRFFVAFDGDDPVGYLEVTDDGENVLTTAPDMLNICGAYLLDDYRGRGIYDALLGFVLDALRIEGVRRLGVDFETMNPTALHFWTRHFERYTSSFARRIDALP